MPTPLMRRPSDPPSNRTKFLIASAAAALFAGYFALGSSERSVEVAVAPHPTTTPPVEFFPLREAEATVVENRAEPDVQTSLPPTARLDGKPTESGTDARPPQTRLPERAKQLFEVSGYGDTCFPSASAVRQNSPEGRPSWTLRAPGHDGTKCWYAASRTTAAEVPAAKAKGLTVQSRGELEIKTAALEPRVRLDIKPTGSEIDARPQQPTSPERANQLFEASRDAECFPSASAVRRNHPGAWPSWTLRAPGHEGTRCWYAPTRATTVEAR